jgi:putative addiction module component (TIGR02574 family)
LTIAVVRWPRLRYDGLVTAKAIFQAAMQLPAREREELIDLLEESLDEGTPEEIEAAWIEETKRRVDEIERGDVRLVSSESVHQMMAEILERARTRRAG